MDGGKNLTKYTFNELVKKFDMEWSVFYELKSRLITIPFYWYMLDKAKINEHSMQTLIDLTSNDKNFAAFNIKSYPENMVLVECFNCLKYYDIKKEQINEMFKMSGVDYGNYKYLMTITCGSCEKQTNMDKLTFGALSKVVRKMLYPKAFLDLTFEE